MPTGGEGERAWKGKRYMVPGDQRGCQITLKNKQVFVDTHKLEPEEDEKEFSEAEVRLRHLDKSMDKTLKVKNTGSPVHLITGTKTGFGEILLQTDPDKTDINTALPVKLKWSKRSVALNVTEQNQFKFGLCLESDAKSTPGVAEKTYSVRMFDASQLHENTNLIIEDNYQVKVEGSTVPLQVIATKSFKDADRKTFFQWVELGCTVLGAVGKTVVQLATLGAA